MTTSNFKHWYLGTDDEQVAWLCFDQHDSAVNTLSSATLNELAQILTQLAQDLPKALVITSAKESSFIVGADIEEFTKIKSARDARDLVERGQNVCQQLEDLPIPTIALIHGFCLGGGMELALACDYRIAEDDPSCRVGLPEVMLGIHPAFGGTVRMIEVAGPTLGMDLMLSGRSLIARSAAKAGIVDKAVPKRHFDLAVADYIERKPAKARASKAQQMLNSAASRPLLAKVLEKKVAEKARREHYPAPYSLINLWKQHGGNRKAMFAAEADSVAELVAHPTSKNLVNVFFLQEGLKKQGKIIDAQPIKHVHVIGAGVMGGDIAAWTALQGMKVTLQDRNPESVTRALKRAQTLFKKKLKIKRAVQAAMDRLHPDLNGDGLKKADLIIEAIFEDLEVKRSLFQEVQENAHSDALLATNTSSIPIEDIASVLKNPGRLVGLHFFNPVAKMQLVEIVSGPQTQAKIAARAAAFAGSIKRLPVPVKSSPGFLVNRVLVPYLIEAVYLQKEGHSIEEIDEAALQFGMPMGPVELADVVGLDICQKVASNILGEDKVPDVIKQKVDNSQLGKKSGTGFYKYKKDKPIKQQVSLTTEQVQQIQDRLILPYLNESVACLDEGIVKNEQLLDGGLIFGTGFAPFTGGPITYIREQGADKLLAKLKTFEKEHGERYTPHKGWNNL